MNSKSSTQISPSRKLPIYNSKNTLQLNSSLTQQPLTGSLNSLSSSNLLKIGPSSDSISNNLSPNKIYSASSYSNSNKSNPNDHYQYPLKNDKETDPLIVPNKKLTATTFINQPLSNPTLNYGQNKAQRLSPSTHSHSNLEEQQANSLYLKPTVTSKVQPNRFYSTGPNPPSNAIKKSTSLKNSARPAIIQPANQPSTIVNLNVINPTYTNSSSVKPVIHKRTPRTFVSPNRFEINNLEQASSKLSNELDQAAPITNEIQLRARSKSKTTDLNNSQNNLLTSSSSIKKTLENIELKMRIVSSPSIRIAELFKCFLKNVPKSTETIESLVHYGDNIGAKVVKCLINENSYEAQSILSPDYDIYQGPALCITYDAILKDEHWDEIFVNNDEEASLQSQNKSSHTARSKSLQKQGINSQASKFMSFFHISDFIAILSGFKVAFVDPYERISTDERSYVAIFDLKNDTNDIEQFEDQFKPLEKIFNVPLLKSKFYNGTIIRLPLRTQNSSCSVSNKLVYVKDILVNAKDFMKEAHLHILFSKNISNIQFCRSKDNQNIEKIYSINVEDSCMEQFKHKYKKINDAVQEGEFPRTSTVIITLRKQIETKIEKTEWILSIFADTMRLLNSNYFLMKLAIPISENCDKDIRFSHKSNLISSDTGFIKTLYLSKPIICYIEDKEGILMSHFCRLNISDSLKLSHFNDAYALMLKDLTKIIRKDPTLLWSLMPDLDKNTEFSELLGEIWQEIAKHELFYSSTEGWGYVAIEDMIINDVDDKSILQEILTKIYSETNYPVVIMPPHVLNALQKFSPKDSLQIMSPSQTSDILHNNVMLIETLKPNQKIELLRYLIKEPLNNNQNAWPSAAARYVLDLPLLLLSNQKFVKFQSTNKAKSVYLVEKDYLKLFNLSDQSNMQYINPDLPKDILSIFKKSEFQRLTQLQMISDSELSDLISVPKEWRCGEEKIQWARNHDKYNLVWLETLWKYLNENFSNNLSIVENMNIVFTNTSHLSQINLYKLSNNSNLVYTPSNFALDEPMVSVELYDNLVRILKKLNFQCIDSLPDIVLSHPLFFNYVPNLKKNRLGLLQAFKNKYRHASTIKVIQDFNALLNDPDIKLIQKYLSKIELSYSNTNLNSNERELLEFIKFLPMFENSALESMDKYIPLKECLYVYYDTQIRLPFELPGLQSFILVDTLDTKTLIQDKLGLDICKEFTFILQEILKYLQDRDRNSLNSIKIHILGKWLLLNCSTYLLGSNELYESIRSTKLFLNQNQELCSPGQFINPGKNDKYLAILESKILPSQDLLQDDKCINVLKELKMRSYTQLKIDEIIDLYEQSIKSMNETNRRLLAELIIEILMNRYEQNESLLVEYSTSKAVNLRHYLTSVNWIPLKKDRPQSYPQSVTWRGADPAMNNRFSSPKDCVDQSYSYCVGSVNCISDIDIPNQLKDFLDLKKVYLDQVVRHLKITTKCFESSALKIEWYDYLTLSKKCYEFMSAHETASINRELKSNDLTEWIWTGSGFSSISSVYLLNDKDHPLSSHLDTLPYELYPYLAFFESLGMKKTPDAKQLESIILKCVKNTHKLINSAKLMSKDQILENAAKNYPLINYIKLNYPNEAKLINNIKDYEESLLNLSSSVNPFVTQPIGLSMNNMNEVPADLIYLYLPDVYKSVDIKDNLINSVMSLIKTKHFKLLDEEAYLIKKSQQCTNLYDHYRVYNEIILPNLNNLSKNVKDSVVLFALDHADTKMLEILKDHPCIPVSPYGRRIKKPNKLIHPNGKLAPLYSDADERFPFGSEQAYIREDRLQILKILGMKCDQPTWNELIERAESVSKIREYDQAVERSIAILNILNEMLSSQEEFLKKNNQNESQELRDIAESLKEISFIPVKQKPYQKLNIYWFGDRFKYRFAKPKELLSAQYELIASSIVAIPLNEYKKKENLLTKSVENFLSIDNWTSKLSFKDVLKHLEELSKSNITDLDDPKEVKLLNDMIYQVYEYIQSECVKTPQLHEYIRMFFHDKKLILINDDFVLASQVILFLNFNLKPIYYQLPQQYHRSFKYLFTQVLPIKPDLDLNDLLLIIDVVKRKYKEQSITNKEDFNLILNVYTLIIDHGYKSINNLYLPNTNSVLMPGRLLSVNSIENKIETMSDYVHSSVDRRVCLIAGCKFTDSNLALVVEQRLFPRVFGNKRLEGILTRLDDERIDINLMTSLDEGNPIIVLQYLLECNRVHSLSQFLSDDDIFVLFKYFNDFVARNYQQSQFTRLKELKLYKPLWSDKYISLSAYSTTNSSIYLINEELFSLIKRSLFKQQQTFNETSIILIKRNELLKLYAHLGLNNLNDVENFLNICLPLFPQMDAKTQNNFLKYLYEEILEKIYSHEKEKCMKILRERLFIQTRSGEHKLISDLYDLKSECLLNILNESYFPDEVFDSPLCIRFLKEAGLRAYLPSELCKRCMNEIEQKVSESGWSDHLRLKSKYVYQHLVENWQRFDDSVLQQRFLEPYTPDARFVQLKKPFEYEQFKRTCLKLSDAELQTHELLVWSSSFLLPKFVDTTKLDINTIEFLKLNKKPCFALVNVHLNNVCADTNGIDQKCLIEALCHIYKYLNEMNVTEADKDILKQLEDKEIVWSDTTRKFVSPNKICVNLEASDECAPFLYSLSADLVDYKSLFVRLGAKDKPNAMLYGDILRKMAKVCANDYLNSNELCKALKAMEGFFKYLKLNPDTITPQFKLPGLYFVTTELKLEKSSNCVIVDTRDSLDDLAKLNHDKFVFNPGERCFKMSTGEIKPLIDKIFISQRPTLFSQKYESTYDYTLPDDPDSQRQNLLTSLERKYQQIFTSRQLHRCLARCISNEEARRSSPKHLAIDEVEKVIRDRLSSIKVTCVEYLETSLSYRKLSNQQKIEQTVEEKACYLTNENHQFSTLYVSKKHIEQAYFSLCLARSLQPLLIDLHFDYSILTTLIATSVSLMSRLLQLVNVATEENILSVIKLQYVPSSGKLYGDDVQLLAPYDPKLHSVLIGDLCVFQNEQGVYLYCQIVKIVDDHFVVLVGDEPAQTSHVAKKDLFVLENWHRIYDAMQAKPPDERESFKYSDNFSHDAKNKANGSNQHNSANNSNESNFEDSSNASDTSDVKSETSSNYDGSSENIPSAFELEQAKNEVNNELRLLWSLEENERKKKINRLLLKWHPDKNTGKEKFASEVFKHLKKQIELYKNDPFLAGFNYRSSYSSYTSGFSSAGTTSYGSTTGDDYRSRHYNSFENLNRKGSPGGSGAHSPHSSPSRESGSTGAGSGFDYDTKGPGASNLGRAGSFRQEWERRRQQKRQTGTGDRSSPSSARRRGTDFTQMDATLWFTQAKADLESANNDMHPLTGKPAYEWVCYKCYRAVEKALRAYHYFKGNGKLPASDIHGLLLGVDTNIRDIAFRFCNFIGNEANSMQYPGIARFGKTPNEVFPLTKAEQALEYGKELLKLVEDIIYAT